MTIYYPLWYGVAVAPVFAPTDAAGLQTWFKADGTLWQDSARTVVASVDADPVGAWDDGSGNAHHALQAVATQRGTLKLGIQNGRPMVRSDGVDDKLITDSVAHGIGFADWYMIAAIKNVAVSGGDRLVMALGGGNMEIDYRASNLLGGYFGGYRYFNTVLAASTAYLFEMWRSSSVMYAALNAVQEAATPADASNIVNGAIYLFGSGPEYGGLDIGEICFYNAFPSAGNITSLRSYFNTRWAIY